MKYIKVIFILFCPFFLNAQNLVPNYSFEDTVAVKVTPLYLPKYWDAPTREGWNYFTPFNNLSQQHLLFSAPSNQNGFQKAKTGNSYAGLNLDDYFTNPRRLRREYLQLTVCNYSSA